MDSDQAGSQDGPKVPSSSSTLVQTSIDGVALEPKTKKLSMEERLSLLSKYRIRPQSIRSTAKPNTKGGKADVVRASFRRKKRARCKRVAVKKLRFSVTMDEGKFTRAFVHEVELLATLSHENIIQLIGFVEELKSKKAWIVLSWEPNGNVREFLASGKWEIPERISLIQNTFNGLEYLHTRQPPICHGDLKSLNILVSASYRAVITDFGSARVMRNEVSQEVDQANLQHGGQDLPVAEGDNQTEVTVVASVNQLTLTGPVWSLRWAAPELVTEGELPGLASDIWSAGWVCWEVMTDKVPFEDLKQYGPITLKVAQGKVPKIHEDGQLTQVIALCSLMMDCWKYKPQDRPHIVQCCKEVRWMPSVVPLGRTPSDRKEVSPTLLLEVGRMRYLQGRQEMAVSLLEKAVTCAGSDDAVVAGALEYLGHSCRSQSKHTEAENRYVRAQEIYARIDDERGQAHTILGLGDVRRLQSKYAEAEESYRQAQEIYARIGDDQGLAHTIQGLGDVYRAQKKYAEAEESYTRAQEFFTSTGNDQGRAHTTLGLGDIYHVQSRYAEAEESYTRAQEIYTRMGDDQGRAHTIHGLADVFRAQSKYTEAEESYTQAQDIYARIGDAQGQAHTIWGLGNLHRAQSMYDKAEESYTRAKGIYSDIGDDLGRAKTLDGLDLLYEERHSEMEEKSFYTDARALDSPIGRSDDADDASYCLDTPLDEEDAKDMALVA